MAPTPKKRRSGPRRDGRFVMYVRVSGPDHQRIEQLVKERGYPHTLSSVAAEMITRGLDAGGDSAKAAS